MEHNRHDLLIVSPRMLSFYAPYDRMQRRLLTMLNPSAERLVFKVKAKADEQRHYNVTPNCGVIEAYGTTEISISLNYFLYDANRNYRHRFCVQCMRAPAELPEPEQLLESFRSVRRCAMYNVRIEVQLEAHAVPVSSTELTTMQFHRTPAQQPMPPEPPPCAKCEEIGLLRKWRGGLAGKLIALILLAGGVGLAYYQRQQIVMFLHTVDKAQDVEF